MPGQKEVPHMITYIWTRTGTNPGTMYAVPVDREVITVRRLRKRMASEPGFRYVTYASLGDADALVRYAARATGANRWVVPLLICAKDPMRYDVESILIASRWLWA